MSETFRNIAGCIPVEGKKLFNFAWHDCFLPVGDGITALERSLYDCAYAGCSSIWITCPYDILPFIKKMIGDFITDPIYRMEIFENYNTKRIPVYYVPLRVLDYDRKESLGWSVINSAMWAKKVTSKFSEHLIPRKFFVSVPYGIHDPEILKEYRGQFASKTNVVIEHNEESVFSGAYLPFTFDSKDFEEVLSSTKEKIKKRFDKCAYVPVSEHIFAKDLPFDEFFECLRGKEHCTQVTPWYYKADSWKGYQRYTSTEHTLDLKKLEFGKVDRIEEERIED